MSDEARNRGSVTGDELAAFARRLAEWGESLPESERPFVQALIERARELDLEQALEERVMQSTADAARAAIRAFNERWSASGSVWLLIGPIWLRAIKRDFGEEVEVTQRLEIREKE